MNAFNVYLKGKFFDTVFFDRAMTIDAVKESLVNNLGLPKSVGVCPVRF